MQEKPDLELWVMMAFITLIIFGYIMILITNQEFKNDCGNKGGYTIISENGRHCIIKEET